MKKSIKLGTATRRMFTAAAVATSLMTSFGASQVLAETQHPEGFNPEEWVIVA